MARKRDRDDRAPARRPADGPARAIERGAAGEGGAEREESALKSLLDREIADAFRHLVRSAVAERHDIAGPGTDGKPARVRVERLIAETRAMSESAIGRYETNLDKRGNPSTSDYDGKREDVAPSCDVFVHAVAALGLTLTMPGRKVANHAIARTLTRMRERERGGAGTSIEASGVEVVRFFLANQPSLSSGSTDRTVDAMARWPFAGLLPAPPGDAGGRDRFERLYRDWNAPFRRLAAATGYAWLLQGGPT